MFRIDVADQNWNRTPTSISRGLKALIGWPKRGEVWTPMNVPKLVRLKALLALAKTLTFMGAPPDELAWSSKAFDGDWTSSGAAARRGSDLNGNGILDPDEPAGPPVLFGPSTGDPAFLTPTDRVDSGLKPIIWDGFILGADHVLFPDFVVGGKLTIRQGSKVPQVIDLVEQADGAIRTVGRADYVPDMTIDGTLPNGAPYATSTSIRAWC